MGSSTPSKKPHVVCIPYPAQGHINPMLKLSKLLHSHGFHISFINTHFNHNRLLRSRGPDSLAGLPDFVFLAIPDGLPPSPADATQDIPSLCHSTTNTCFLPFLNLLRQLNAESSVSNRPPVTAIVADAAMVFPVRAAAEIGVPIALLWTVSACGTLGYMHLPGLVQRGLVPLKDSSDLTNGYLETKVDWIPPKSRMPLKSFPTFIRTTNPNDIMLNYLLQVADQAPKASLGLILNTFQTLESHVLTSLSSLFPSLLPIGPLHLLSDQLLTDLNLSSMAANLWTEDSRCLQWLDLKEPKSVLYVNFGSITVMSEEQVMELAWGLKNSQKDFLWVIRPDLVAGDSTGLSPEFLSEIEGRSMVVRWCPQEEVLKHTAVGGFLTHCGWNSTMESIACGVPMICWPVFAEQQMNCKHCCEDWGVGVEMKSEVKREEVEELVRALMEGDSGKEMREKAAEWKRKAEEAVKPGGSSFQNLDKLVSQLSNTKNMVL